MNSAIKWVGLMASWCAGSGVAAAQPSSPPAAAPADSAAAASTTKPATQTAQSEAGEPRADTSTAPPVPAGSPPSAASPVRASASAAPPGRAASGRAAAGSGSKPANTIDRLALGTATVTGSQEQPKVMYIVPWKRSDIGDLAGKPMNSLVDEILAPVDRDVFKREVIYYQAVQADASQNGAPARPSPQGEK